MKRAILLSVSVLFACGGNEPPAPQAGAQISLVEVATLGGSEEISPHPLSRLSVQVRASDTIFWVSPTYEHGVLHGYGDSGMIESRLGGPGEGPGELGGLSQATVHWIGSLAYVVSMGSPRLTVFDVEADTVGTENLPWPVVTSATTPDGELLLAPWYSDPTPVVRRSTGDLEPVIAQDTSTRWIHGSVLAGRSEPPRLGWIANAWTGDIYSVDRDLNARFEWSLVLPDSVDAPGSARLVGLAESDGVLWAWIARQLADLDVSALRFGPTTLDSIYDTRIVALDPATGAELASHDDTRWLTHVDSDRGAFTINIFETDIGDTRIGVYRPSLERNGAR